MKAFVVPPSAILASHLSVCLRGGVVVDTVRAILTLERDTRFFSSSSASLSILPSIRNHEVASPRFALGDQLRLRGSSRRSCCCIESDDHRGARRGEWPGIAGHQPPTPPGRGIDHARADRKVAWLQRATMKDVVIDPGGRFALSLDHLVPSL